MAKLNCWDIKRCGRESGGKNSTTLGVCPAATAETCHGRNGGTNGGRYCWRIAGTMCDEDTQGTFATKVETCGNCDVFQAVIREEGVHFVL